MADFPIFFLLGRVFCILGAGCNRVVTVFLFHKSLQPFPTQPCVSPNHYQWIIGADYTWIICDISINLLICKIVQEIATMFGYTRLSLHHRIICLKPSLQCLL